MEKDYEMKNGYRMIPATMDHLDEMERLYDTLNDYLQAGINYPGWLKGVYPIRETAYEGIKNNTLFVVMKDNEIAGSVILNHVPEDAYPQATWGIETDYANIIVIHTLVVHPKYLKCGVGKLLMDFIKAYSIQNNMKAIRLDVSIHNTPALALYEKCGFQYIDTVDLGLNYPHLKWFKLYEMIL